MLIHLVARRAVFALLFVVLAASEAWAQFDFVGSWAPLGTEDVQNDSVPVDYLGLALTEEGRARALSYNESQKSMIERQCASWGAAYVVLGPFGLRVSSQTDPVTSRPVSFTIGAWEDWNEMVIWMDDRPRPSEHALHTQCVEAHFVQRTRHGLVRLNSTIADRRLARNCLQREKAGQKQKGVFHRARRA